MLAPVRAHEFRRLLRLLRLELVADAVGVLVAQQRIADPDPSALELSRAATPSSATPVTVAHSRSAMLPASGP